MRVRITLSQGYENENGVKGEFGEVVDVSEDLGLKLIRVGFATLAPEPVIETVAMPAPENTAQRVGKPAPRKSKAGSRKGTFSAKKE